MDNRRVDNLLERHLLGELTPDQEKEVRSILSTEPGRRRLEELRSQDEEALHELPPRVVAGEIRRRMESAPHRPDTRPSRSWGRLAFFPAGLAAAAALVAVLWVPADRSPRQPVAAAASRGSAAGSIDPAVLPSSAQPSLRPSAPQAAPSSDPVQAAADPGPLAQADIPGTDDGIRTKGSSQRLRIHRVDANSGAAVALADGSGASAGDILQVGLLRGPAKWVAVVSVDAEGRTTRHIPESGESSVSAEDALQAPHSFQLDATPGFERFVLFLSDRPFPVRDAERILSRCGRKALQLPPGWSSESILVSKPEPKP